MTRSLICLTLVLFATAPMARGDLVSGNVVYELNAACPSGGLAQGEYSSPSVSLGGSIGCPYRTSISFASVQAAGGGGQDGISGSASAINGGAFIGVGYSDTVFLIAPAGPPQNVVVTIADSYVLSVSTSGPSDSATAQVGFTAPGVVGGSASLLIEPGDAVTGLADSGVFSGQFTMQNCPASGNLCSFLVSWGGDAEAEGTSSASFSDPLSIGLPTGWTFTLASQEVAAVPEPSSLSLTLLACCAWALIVRLRRDQIRAGIAVEVSLRGLETRQQWGKTGSWLDQIISQAVMPNSAEMKPACAMVSPFATRLARPLRILFTASIPCNVRHAVANEP